LYFLFGESKDGAKDLVYIGESEDCSIRLKDHNREKDFWTHAIVMRSSKKAFTKGHVKFLEYLAIKEARRLGWYLIENKGIPNKTHVLEPMEADLLDAFETIKILLSTLGYGLFDELDSQEKDIFYINSVGVKATGEYTDDGFVILKGSEARIKESKSLYGRVSDIRIRLLNDGTIKKKGEEKFVFEKNYKSSSPSSASDLIIGNSTNGWDVWKNKAGVTLNELKRN